MTQQSILDRLADQARNTHTPTREGHSETEQPAPGWYVRAFATNTGGAIRGSTLRVRYQTQRTGEPWTNASRATAAEFVCDAIATLASGPESFGGDA